MFRKATPADIPLIKDLAYKIWPDAYGAILTPGQLEYMLDYIYSESALQKQMEDGQQFVIVYNNEAPAGFAAYSLFDKNSSVYKLHKLYILPSTQGTGLGKDLLTHVIDNIKKAGGVNLILNVNRNNKARNFYEKAGFSIIKEEDVPIGNNYFMNDYVMEKKLADN